MNCCKSKNTCRLKLPPTSLFGLISELVPFPIIFMTWSIFENQFISGFSPIYWKWKQKCFKSLFLLNHVLYLNHQSHLWNLCQNIPIGKNSFLRSWLLSQPMVILSPKCSLCISFISSSANVVTWTCNNNRAWKKTDSCKITIIQSPRVKECFNAAKEQPLIKHTLSHMDIDACLLENMKR